jgi:hypothetical protein
MAVPVLSRAKNALYPAKEARQPPHLSQNGFCVAEPYCYFMRLFSSVGTKKKRKGIVCVVFQRLRGI